MTEYTSQKTGGLFSWMGGCKIVDVEVSSVSTLEILRGSYHLGILGAKIIERKGKRKKQKEKMEAQSGGKVNFS